MNVKAARAMRHVDPKEKPIKEVHSLLIGGVSPRPIALVGTVSKSGQPNLAPFSFFNAFGANPPTIAFSPARRGRDGSYKDTYRNLVATGECTVQLVAYSMVEQISLASAEVPPEVNEFDLSGLTPLESDLVAPPRVQESPYQMECKLQQMIPLGEGNGSGNLAICEVIRFHVLEELFDENGRIDPHRLDVVGRNGYNYYTRASGDAIFPCDKPVPGELIGWNGLPEKMRQSEVYTANDLGKFANWNRIPSKDEAESALGPIALQELDSASFDAAEQDGDWQVLAAMALHGREPARLQRAARAALRADEKQVAWCLAVL